MKFTLPILATTFAVSTATMNAAPAFEEFKVKHGKNYASAEEHTKRFEIFVNNVEEFKQLNADLKAKGRDEIHGVTKFSDMTREEFTSVYLGAKFTKDSFPKVSRVAKTEDFIQTVNTTVTGAYSLWDDSFASPVKDQAQCGKLLVAARPILHYFISYILHIILVV